MDKHHQLILRRNHRLVVNSLDLTRSSVLDRLVEEELLSGGEQEDILSRVTSRDQITRLLFVLKRRDNGGHTYDAFVHALQPEYDFVAKKLKACEKELISEQGQFPEDCVHCQLVQNLIPNDVSHFLYEEEVISDDDLEELNNKGIPRPDRVKRLFGMLQKEPDPLSIFEKFRQSLEPKYIYILSKETVRCLNDFLVCSCNRMVGQEHIDTGQYHGMSSHQARVPLLDVTTGNGIMTQASCYVHGRDEMYGHEHSDIAGSFPSSVWAQESTPYTCNSLAKAIGAIGLEGGTVKVKKKIRRRRKIAFDEPDSVIVPIHEQPLSAESPDIIYQSVGLSLPNDRKLMRRCSKLWDNLFTLREKGDWTTFNLVSMKAFERFNDCPDIQVLLWRSEMCISTFYKNDPTKAMTMFDNAMALLPKTSMPNWHLARILPLRMELCTRSKQFEEANSLLEQAHQAMSTLSPCLSTGAVYFFEANYLRTFLRCSGSGSIKAQSIADRVKTCFLTAIEHYKKEKVFAIQSFLNQVYLFYALFILGVDFKTVSYIAVRCEKREGDLEKADHYLSLFEDSCWETSTTWSRMLFYIGRGEQHKLKGNSMRSLDYYNLAKQCSEEGDFTEQLDFINHNIALTTDRLQEQEQVLALKQKSADAIIQSLFDSTDDSGSSDIS